MTNRNRKTQELIKPIVRVGNSAGVILPREWLNGKVRVELVERPLDIKQDILEILEDYLEEVIGIYIVGSYARGEQTKDSDVDVLVITNKKRKIICMGKYNIIMTTKEVVEEEMKNNILPLLPMIKEARAVMNADLVKKWKETKLTKKNLRLHIELTKSALKVNRKAIDLDKEWPSNCGDAVAYSLVLRLRGIYLVDCMRKNKGWSTNGLKTLIKKITGSLKAYEGYLRVKNNGKRREELPVEEAEKLYAYDLKKIREQEKWLKERKS